VAVQRRLAAGVVLEPLRAVRLVLGLDCAFSGDSVLAVGVVWDLERQTVVETRGVRAPLRFPYVPGLLSFRELPVLLEVARRVQSPVDVVMCDGQGIAHPRRFGIAAHFGVVTGLPAVGCAKSRLWGRYEPVGETRGAWQPLVAEDDSGDVIGCVLRTRDRVKPVFVSPGHLCDLASAADLVLACGAGYRIPEPTRQADRRVAAFKRAGRYRGGLTVEAESEAK
jgi:deoxyribonuclease V